MSTDEVDVMSGLVIVEKPGDGKCVAVDVENEYVVFLTLAPENRET